MLNLDSFQKGYHSEPVPEVVESMSRIDNRRQPSPVYQKQRAYKKPSGMAKKPYRGPKHPQNALRNVDHAENANVANTNTQQQYSPFIPAELTAPYDPMFGFKPMYDGNPEQQRKEASSTNIKTPAMKAKRYRKQKRRAKINKRRANKKSNKSAGKPGYFKGNQVPDLQFDLTTGRVYDANTGKWFRLVKE